MIKVTVPDFQGDALASVAFRFFSDQASFFDFPTLSHERYLSLMERLMAKLREFDQQRLKAFWIINGELCYDDVTMKLYAEACGIEGNPWKVLTFYIEVRSALWIPLNQWKRER